MEPAWKHWGHWLLWWKADPAELRRGSLFASRRVGALVAAYVSAVTAMVAFRLMPYDPATSLVISPGSGMAGFLLLALAMGWLAFGGLLLRGHRVALPGLMAVGCIEFAAGGGMLLAAGCADWPYHATHWPILRSGMLLVPTWTMLMHLYYLAFRIERGGLGAA